MDPCRVAVVPHGMGLFGVHVPELAGAHRLLGDRRIELAFEAYGSGKPGPDFTVTYRERRSFNLEVTRPHRSPDAASYAGPLLAKLRQLPPSAPNAVLLATASFWQGVDVVGEALSCVIIDKLPFSSPCDPVTAARIDAINAAGGDAFSDYQVPLAILTLQQGLGRLIRHRRDRGVLAVLDPRLRTKGYGARFLASLPPAPAVHDLSRIEAFFSD